MIENKAFCAAPWAEIVMRTTKKINVCCNASRLDPTNAHIEDTTINDFFNGPAVASVRTALKQGQQIPLCNNCYESEARYNNSMRLDMNRKYGFTEKNFQQRLEQLERVNFPRHTELHVSNLCNLKCLTCNPTDSSQFLAEERMLGNTQWNQDDYTFSDDLIQRLFDEVMHSDTKLVDLRGGETLLVPKVKQYLKDVDVNLTKNKRLKIQTNGTIFDTVWKDIFLKFESVDVSLSIDAYDQHNEYIRHPAKWDRILNTIDIIRTIENTIFSVSCTVSNLNWMVLPTFLDWIIEQNVYCGFSGVYSPSMFVIQNLPDKFLDRYTAAIEPYIGRLPAEGSNSNLQNIVAGVKQNKNFNTALWNSFCKEIAKRDNFRKNSIECLDPELYRTFFL